MEEKITGDMYLAAALISYEAKLINIDKSDMKRQRFYFAGIIPVAFVFVDGEVKELHDCSLDDMERFYIARSLMYPPSYPEAIRNMKTAIHSE